MHLQHIFLLLCGSVALATAVVRFTNLKCTSLDLEFSTFEKCKLKMLRRGVVGLNVTCKLLKTPVTNVSVNLSFFKKSNGYHFFMYNSSGDFCKFLRNRKQYPLLKAAGDYLLINTNVNHSCPFNHDIIVNNLVLDQNMFNLLPLPPGEYMFKVMVAAYNEWRAEVKAFFSID